MKKVLNAVMILALSFFTSTAIASQVSVEPGATLNIHNDFKTVVSTGAKVNVSDVNYLPKEVEFSTGLSFQELTSNDNTVTDINTYTIPLEVGYNYALAPAFTVTPKYGVDFILADSSVVDNTVGQHLAVAIKYDLTKNVTLNGSVGYEFAETKINGSKEDLGGVILGGSATYSF